MSPDDIVSYVNARGGKLTDEERTALIAEIEYRIKRLDQARQLGEALIPKLQAIVDEPYKPWREPSILWPAGVFVSVLLFLVWMIVT